ncbi:restriction endonuclease subunit S [Flavobacterium sp.]|jgi:type I restriction enzyme S subunit|uniref:restriction endonuclease subunit S n=1 Tax=Flavobacterium sp. TaxID=239 RepID=UPI0037837766
MNWEVKKGFESIEFFNGKSIKVENEVGLNPIYGSNGKIGTTNKSIYNDAIIIGRVGAYCGAVQIEKGDFWATDNTIVVKAKEENQNMFWYYLLHNSRLNNFAGGSAQPLITQGTLKELKFFVPPLEIQKRIASILSNYDDLIENNLKRIKLLEETAQNIYKEWFVNFRFPNYEHTEFDTESGLPVGWEIKKADNVYDINIGKTPPRGETQWFSLTDGIKWVSIADMNKSTVFVINTNEKITKDGVDKFNMRKASIGSVLLSFKLTVGSVAITNEEVVSNEAIAHFNLLEDSILTTEYTYQFLKNFHYPSLGSTSSIGTSINSKIVKNMDIVIPNENLIKEFSKGVKNIFVQIDNLINQNQKLKEGRDILLPRLMNRTIEV